MVAPVRLSVHMFLQLAQSRSIVVVGCKAKYSKKCHETQNQPNILIKGSIADSCVCMYVELAVDHAFNVQIMLTQTVAHIGDV